MRNMITMGEFIVKSRRTTRLATDELTFRSAPSALRRQGGEPEINKAGLSGHHRLHRRPKT